MDEHRPRIMTMGECWFAADEHEGEVWSYAVDRSHWDALARKPVYHKPPARGPRTVGPGWWDDPMLCERHAKQLKGKRV
jgi:hypothetical protein